MSDNIGVEDDPFYADYYNNLRENHEKDLSELLRAADTSHINCEACGKLVGEDDTAPCPFCNKEYVCTDCQIWYRNSISDPLVPNSLKGPLEVLPSHYRPYYKLKSFNPTVTICKPCDVEVEALYVKSIPYTQIPKYLNFPFRHESNKALLLQRASIG